MYETHGLDTQDSVFFYEQDYYMLSNFSSFKVYYSNRLFDTAEHAYHYNKFIYYTRDDRPAGIERGKKLHEIREHILSGCKSAHEAFTYARSMKEFANTEWNNYREICMREILHAKCEQHEYVARKLEQTGDRQLVENSWRDDVWGIGPNGDGQNLLGKAWMSVRDSRRSHAKWMESANASRSVVE